MFDLHALLLVYYLSGMAALVAYVRYAMDWRRIPHYEPEHINGADS